MPEAVVDSARMRGGVAGALAAAAWNAYDPLLKRAFKTPYADSEVLGPFITEGRYEWVANLATHMAGGFAFGSLFERFGGRTPKQGVAAAVVENTVLWPVLAAIERVHPKRKRGEWPPLLLNARAFAGATAGHALFGALLGYGVSRGRTPATRRQWTKLGRLRSQAPRATSADGWRRRSRRAATPFGR
jgi:hypothetical protein